MSSRITYSDLFGLEQAPPGPRIPAVGDVVVTGHSDWPRFTVVAVSEGKAWVRGVHSDDDSVVALERCRLVMHATIRQSTG